MNTQAETKARARRASTTKQLTSGFSYDQLRCVAGKSYTASILCIAIMKEAFDPCYAGNAGGCSLAALEPADHEADLGSFCLSTMANFPTKEIPSLGQPSQDLRRETDPRTTGEIVRP